MNKDAMGLIYGQYSHPVEFIPESSRKIIAIPAALETNKPPVKPVV